MAVIGTGFGAEHAYALQRATGYDIAAVVYGRRRDVAQKLAEEVGCDVVTDDLDRVVEHCDVDLAVVSSPVWMHAAHARAALDRGIDVIVDKPVATTARDAQALATLADSTGAGAWTFLQWRVHPGFVALRDAVEEQGKPTSVIGSFSHGFLGTGTTAFPWRHTWTEAGAGAFGDLGAHLFDAIAWMLPAPASVVSAHGRVAFATRLCAEGGTVVAETEDSGTALVAGPGWIGAVTVDRTAAGRHQLALSISGSNWHASLEIDPDTGGGVATCDHQTIWRAASEDPTAGFYRTLRDAPGLVPTIADALPGQELFDSTASIIRPAHRPQCEGDVASGS